MIRRPPRSTLFSLHDALPISKPVSVFPRGHFDRIVNMSGYPMPGFPVATEWKVRDPIGGTPEQYRVVRSEEHTSELQSRLHLVCRLLLEKKKQTKKNPQTVAD